MKLKQNNSKTVWYNKSLKYFILFLILLPYFVSSLHYVDEWDGTDRIKHYWCKRLQTCTPTNETVCGWDADTSFLAQFENICIYYRANCRGAGKFEQVQMIVCETKMKYDREHPKGEEFEWIHIEGGTSASTTTFDPLTVTNMTGLRHKNEDFLTLYPEGGTLPPNFFYEPKEVLRKRHKPTKSPSDIEWKHKVLELLWRRAADSRILKLLLRRTVGTSH